MLTWARQLAAPACALAYRSDELTGIDLPEVGDPVADRARLLAVAPLYLVAELDATGLLSGAEMLAGLAASGGLAIPDDAGLTAELHAFWLQRNQRFAAAERAAVFARLFGRPFGPVLAVRGNSNTSFEPLLIDLADALYAGGAARRSPAAAVAVAAAGHALSANLENRQDGIPDVAAAELVANAHEALELFKHASLQLAVGAHGVWPAVGAVARRYLADDPPVALHVSRGRSGMVVLAWLADALGTAMDGPAARQPEPTVVTAAGEWLQSTLALHETTHSDPRGGR
jgi:hypothetical protein